jgi:hypothetical protein
MAGRQVPQGESDDQTGLDGSSLPLYLDVVAKSRPLWGAPIGEESDATSTLFG